MDQIRTLSSRAPNTVWPLRKQLIWGLGGFVVAGGIIVVLWNWSRIAAFTENHFRLFAVTLLIAALVISIFIVWKLPKLQVAKAFGSTRKNRFERENEARKTLAQIIGGMFILAGFFSSILTIELQRKGQITIQEGQITDRFSRAIEQLGAVEPGGKMQSDGRPMINIEVRLGGIYSLERIAHDSPRDAWAIIEILSTYARENSSTRGVVAAKAMETSCMTENLQQSSDEIEPEILRADIQAALTVIGRREASLDPKGKIIDLSNTNLRGAILSEAKLAGANLRRTSLAEAHLERSDLRGADFRCTNLTGTILVAANVEGADFHWALGVTQDQINQMVGDKNTILPPDRQRPGAWQ
jgi:hypothetical protein